MKKTWLWLAPAAVGAFLFTGAAWAAGPEKWQLGFQPAVTPLAEQTAGFHDLLLVIITGIAAFVFVLLATVIIRFNRRANPQPSKTAHNTPLEMAWTIVPVMILVAIAIPSLRLLYAADVSPPADLTVKAIGHQWYWSYEYPDNGGFLYDAFMLEADELEPGQPRLLATDTEVVVPVNKVVRVQVTSTDVIHAWAVPAFALKVDAVPGRLNEVWFKATQEGTFYGQCSELCGTRHGYMPITVRVVSEPEFEAWVEEMRAEYAALSPDADHPEGPPHAPVELALTASR